MSLEFGYIALQRDLVNWEWYSNINVKVLYLELLLSVNYEDKEWQGITVKKGSIITSLPQLVVKTGLTNRQVRTALKKLVDSNYLTDKSTNKFRYISVIDYDRYVSASRQTADKRQTNGRQTTDKRQTNDSNVISTKNYKEIKEIKEKPKFVADATPVPTSSNSSTTKKKNVGVDFEKMINDYTSTDELRAVLNDFVISRKNMKKVWQTERGFKSVLTTLSKLASDDDTIKIKIVDQTLENCWKGFFALKTDEGNESTKVVKVGGEKEEALARMMANND